MAKEPDGLDLLRGRVARLEDAVKHIATTVDAAIAHNPLNGAPEPATTEAELVLWRRLFAPVLEAWVVGDEQALHALLAQAHLTLNRQT